MQLHAHTRETISLDGTWSAIPDQYEQFGESGPFEGHRIFDPADQWEPIDADVDDGYETTVPSCWNTDLPGFEQYEGVMWYSRRFAWSDDADRLLLRFGAVNYRADVWLNGSHLGSHEGGFTPFALEITDTVERGPDNLLVVRVETQRDRRALPDEVTDWYPFSGITRSVELVPVSRRFVRNCKVETTVEGSEIELRVRAWVDDPDQQGEPGTASLPELDRSWDLQPKKEWSASPHRGTDSVARGVIVEGSVTIDSDALDFWHPDTPQLYDLQVEFADDRVSDRVGVRTWSVEGSDVLLNDEAIDLRGISLHEEAVGRGRSLTPADRQERFDWIEELGCNFVRLAHYPHHAAMARRADEAGVLLWAEVPAYWSIDFGEPAVQSAYRQQLRELIQRDWNRPSIALWSIANETDHEDETRNAVLSEMVSTVREFDETRLVTAACFVDESNDAFEIADPLVDHLDVVGINEYQGWYTGEPDDLRRFDDDPDGPPVIISEVGAGAKRGNHGTRDERWTEEHQAEFYRTQLATIDEMEQCCGLSPWILFDFRSPRRQNPHQRGYNRKGLLDEHGKRKRAFTVLRRYYENERDSR